MKLHIPEWSEVGCFTAAAESEGVIITEAYFPCFHLDTKQENAKTDI